MENLEMDPDEPGMFVAIALNYNIARICDGIGGLPIIGNAPTRSFDTIKPKIMWWLKNHPRITAQHDLFEGWHPETKLSPVFSYAAENTESSNFSVMLESLMMLSRMEEVSVSISSVDSSLPLEMWFDLAKDMYAMTDELKVVEKCLTTFRKVWSRCQTPVSPRELIELWCDHGDNVEQIVWRLERDDA